MVNRWQTGYSLLPLNMTISEEIIESMALHPESWKRKVITEKFECCSSAYCKNRFSGWEQIYYDSNYWNAPWDCASCEKKFAKGTYSIKCIYKKEYISISHESGYVLMNDTPYDNKGWKIIEPAYINLGFFEERALRKAVVKLLKAQASQALLESY